MTSVRNILTDLIERRLWPVAAALVVALVAVPVLLGGGSDATAPAPAPAPVASAAAAGSATGAAISVATPSSARKNRRGAVRNPFIQHHSKSTSSKTSTGGGDKAKASGDGAAPSGSGGTVTPGSGPGKRDGRTDTNVWRVNLRFGQAGHQHIRHDVPRLTPLPSSNDPFFVFMGVLSDGKTAVFLISSDAVANGDGTCRPSPTDCETVELKAGDTEFFDVTTGLASVTQFELDLLKVSKTAVRSAAVARKARRRESEDGRNVLDELIADGDLGLDGYMYSARRGLIYRKHQLKASATANVPSSTTPSG